MVGTSRDSDNAPLRQDLDLLRQQLPLVVAVAQSALTSKAPAPDTAVGGEGEAVVGTSRDSDDAPLRQDLDLLRQQLVG